MGDLHVTHSCSRENSFVLLRFDTMFESIQSSDFVRIGIIPVEIVLKESDGHRRVQKVRVSQQLPSVFTIVIDDFDVIQMAIGEVNLFTYQIEGQAQGHLDGIVDNSRALLPVHAASFNARIFSPIGEKQESHTGAGIDSDRPWIREVLVKQDTSMAAIGTGNFHMLENIVRPVQISTNPVECNTRYEAVSTCNQLEGHTRFELASPR